MPRRDLTLADKIALLEHVKNQPPNTSHHQLVGISNCNFCLPTTNLKTLYSAKLLNYILEAIQENLLTSSTAKEVSARIDLLQAVQFTANSWRRVSTKTIQNGFAHCGFEHSGLEMLNKADSENYVIMEMHHVGKYEEFSCIDNSLQCLCMFNMQMNQIGF
jgi:hypothetical protein